MASALINTFDAQDALNILSFVPLDNFPKEDLYGYTEIYGAKHYITYGGGPEGGFVYFASERDSNRGNWYTWDRDWFKKPTYTKVVEGQVAFLIHSDGSEQIAILPDRWETEVNLEALAETVIIADGATLRELEG